MVQSTGVALNAVTLMALSRTWACWSTMPLWCVRTSMRHVQMGKGAWSPPWRHAGNWPGGAGHHAVHRGVFTRGRHHRRVLQLSPLLVAVMISMFVSFTLGTGGLVWRDPSIRRRMKWWPPTTLYDKEPFSPRHHSGSTTAQTPGTGLEHLRWALQPEAQHPGAGQRRGSMLGGHGAAAGPGRTG